MMDGCKHGHFACTRCVNEQRLKDLQDRVEFLETMNQSLVVQNNELMARLIKIRELAE